MHYYYLTIFTLVPKQHTFWCVVKQHMKIRVKSQDIDWHRLSVLKQHTCFYSVVPKIIPATETRKYRQNRWNNLFETS